MDPHKPKARESIKHRSPRNSLSKSDTDVLKNSNSSISSPDFDSYSEESSTNENEYETNISEDKSRNRSTSCDRSKSVSPPTEKQNNNQNESKNYEPSTSRKQQNNILGCSLFILCVLFVASLAYFIGINGINLKGNKCHDSLNLEINQEVKLSIETALQEIKNFNRPSVLTFIYDTKSESEVDGIVSEIANFATCFLNGGNDFIELTKADVTSSNIMADKGKLITKYQNKLQEQNVMLVKHLEQVPGNVAMVFHFLCDQYTPVVHKALFIFTLQYDKSMESKSEFDIIENVLSNQWNELKPDMFPPLIARLSNAIIKI